MKPDLTFKECENLKKWGLDQTLEEGDRFYDLQGKVHLFLDHEYSKGYWYAISYQASPDLLSHCVKLPSAEEMIEWLKGQGHFDSIYYKPTDKEFIAYSYKEGHWQHFGEDAKLRPTLYALCEKVFGGKEPEKAKT